MHKQKLKDGLKMYTKQHFEDLAQFLKSTTATTKAEMIKALTEHFKADNPKFKTEKFLKAVGCA
jgi:hypothetical protein